ncbi:Calcyclin-binding protein [Thelohanellus kitauei]|uniref:Calcyclin-binding protein n=1 Tax=Thelohanellus kitauei TaxID=669202 RepID=A0A0C2MG79_THEKT|nr:Calcyclin-binding protein [Thelohanellus kitauei]
MSLKEFTKSELEELKNFSRTAFSLRVKQFLDSAIDEIESNLKPKEVEVKPVVSCPIKALRNYSWFQKDNTVRLYIPIPEGFKSDQVDVKVTTTSLGLTVKLDHIHYVFTITKLFDTVTADKFKLDAKASEVVLTIYKTSDKKWDHISAADVKPMPKTPKFDDKNADPSTQMMNLMQQIYENGDDEMKRNINKIWDENRNKMDKKIDPLSGVGV